MTVLTKFRAWRINRNYWRGQKLILVSKAINFFDTSKDFIEAVKALNKAASMMNAKDTALSNYLFEATRQAETSRLSTEAKIKKDEERSPSSFDEKY